MKCPCGVVLPFDQTKNHFELFGLKPCIQINLQLLEYNFRSLQKVFHPDKFMHSSDRERLVSRENSMHINSAYQTLRKPVERVEYALSLMDIELGVTHHDIGFLANIMELRQTIEESCHAKEIEDIICANKREMTLTLQTISDLHGCLVSETSSEGVTESIRDANVATLVSLAEKLKYLSNIDTSASDRLDQLGQSAKALVS